MALLRQASLSGAGNVLDARVCHHMRLQRFRGGARGRVPRVLQPHRARQGPSQRSTSTPLTCAASAAPAPAPAPKSLVNKGEVAVSADKIGKSHDGAHELFSNLSFSVSSGERVVVIGPNGCGKSSLLKIIAGLDEPSSGSLIRRRGLVVGMLEQDPALPNELGALDAVLSMDTPKSRAVQEYEAALSSVEMGELGAEAMLGKCTAQMDTTGAWELASKAKSILSILGIEAGLKVADMSGGQKRRIALAATMLTEPDLLLLDEPTNHLDVGVISWMRDWLNETKMAVMMVTHDRHFMEAVGTRVFELDADGSSHVHNFGGTGSYERFQEARLERRAAQAAVAANAKTLLRTETEWMRRQPKARSTKSKARIDAFYELTDIARSGPKEDQAARFGEGNSMQRQGKKVMELKNASYSWDDATIFQSLNYEFQPGEKIGIVGPNGCGKSTLLDALAGKMELTAGDRELGERTVVGYFNQHPPQVRGDMRVADYLREVADQSSSGSQGGSSFGKALSPTTILDQVCFSRERHFELVEKLSGGERRRLHLAATLMSGPNFLLLDEPTNDLDLQTVEMLEAMLQQYTGVLVVVSHDYQFMDNNADRLFVFEGEGKVKLFDGTYSEYMTLADAKRQQSSPKGALTKDKTTQRSTQTQQSNSAASKLIDQEQPAKLLKLGYREKQEYEGLEDIIDSLGEEQDELTQQISDANAAGDYSTLESLTQKLATVQEELERKTDRWLELAERADV